jgi:hypothetical protein
MLHPCRHDPDYCDPPEAPECVMFPARTRRARKARACAVCGGLIPAGDLYSYQFGLEEGRAVAWHTHVSRHTCEAVFQAEDAANRGSMDEWIAAECGAIEALSPQEAAS